MRLSTAMKLLPHTQLLALLTVVASPTTGILLSKFIIDPTSYTLDVAAHYGYKTEAHYTTTSDGYILRLDRILGTRYNGVTIPGRVVLAMHGTFGTSLGFVANGPDKALGLLLADAKYDVWLGNFRGTPYSRNHTTLSPDIHKNYWHFSYDEMGQKDLPAIVDYITKVTGQDKISYIGYSNGARTYMMAASTEMTALTDKVKIFVCLASTGARTAETNVGTHQIKSLLWTIGEPLGTFEVGGLTSIVRVLNSVTCGGISRGLCIKGISLLLENPPFIDDLNSDKTLDIRRYIIGLMGGTSVRAFSHFSQVINDGKPRMFDFGRTGNLKLYNSPTPPVYDLSKVTTPVAFYWSNTDENTPAGDVQRFLNLVPNVMRTRQIQDDSFSHHDFIFSRNAKTLLYDDVISVLNSVT